MSPWHSMNDRLGMILRYGRMSLAHQYTGLSSGVMVLGIRGQINCGESHFIQIAVADHRAVIQRVSPHNSQLGEKLLQIDNAAPGKPDGDRNTDKKFNKYLSDIAEIHPPVCRPRMHDIPGDDNDKRHKPSEAINKQTP